MNEKEKHEIADRLRLRIGSMVTCPMCHDYQFTILDKYGATQFTEKPPHEHAFSFSSMPVVVLICKKCGFVAQHSVKVLDLSEDDTTGGENE